MKKIHKVSLLALGMAIGPVVTAAGYVNAADNSTNNLPPMVASLVEKFDLSEEEVSAHLEEEREEHRTQREAELNESLSSALEEGKITEDQYNGILEKHEEIAATREPMFQTRGAVKGRADGLRSYLEDEGIDADILPEREGFGQRRGDRAGNGTCQNQ